MSSRMRWILWSSPWLLLGGYIGWVQLSPAHLADLSSRMEHDAALHTLEALPWKKQGYLALQKQAREAEAARDLPRAQAAWSAMRRAALSTSSLLGQHRKWLLLANQNLARLAHQAPLQPGTFGQNPDEGQLLALLNRPSTPPLATCWLLAIGTLLLTPSSALLLRGKHTTPTRVCALLGVLLCALASLH